ncbi:APC family permease [Thiotrichales bacterium 19X7-9]|nr:APC family permease [Thiotrichales bacterium 19X7-9]
MSINIHHHKIGFIALTAIGIGTMIGSGWLFSSFYAAKIAGPSAFLAWLVTAVIILILGLCLAEISFNYPKRGLMARLLVISHNKEFAFICTIATWLGLTAVIATEAEGSIQYLSSLSATISPYLFDTVTHQLTHIGLLVSICMVLLFGVINFWGVKILSHSNVLLTVVKVCIPTITAISIMLASFKSSNFHSTGHGFMPYGFSSVFSAMIGAGMIYSFNGFQNIVSFSSEAKNPKRDIPLAMILSIIITLLVYMVLQTSFIGSIDISSGWKNLNFTSPFVQITMMLNLNLMTIVLYVDAVASPSGTGLIYTGSTTRMLTGMSEDKQMPAFFMKMSKYNFSRRSLVTTILLAIVFLVMFKSWASLVSFLSLFYVISYMSIPVCLGKLRAHKIKGQFSIPFIQFLLPFIFAFLSILFIFSGFPYTVYVVGFICLAFIGYTLTQMRYHDSFLQVVLKSSPLLCHVIVLAVLSMLGPLKYGGIGLLSSNLFFGLIVIVSLITYFLVTYVYKSTPEQVV